MSVKCSLTLSDVCMFLLDCDSVVVITFYVVVCFFFPLVRFMSAGRPDVCQCVYLGCLLQKTILF